MKLLKFIDLSSPVAKKRSLVIILTVLSVFVGILSLGIAYTDTAGFCNLCHSMKPYYKALQKSAHGRFPCMACHAPKGGAGALTVEHVMSYQLLLAEYVTGYEKPINPENKWGIEHIEKEQCTRCHNLETRKVTPSESVPNMTSLTHIQHLKAGLRCTTCHNRIAHKALDDGEIEYEKEEKGPSFKYKNFLTMKDGCWRCHNPEKPYTAPNGATAPTGCTVCHSRKWKGLPVGHLEGWRTKVHGQVAQKNIGYCLGGKSINGKTSGCHAATAQFNTEDGKPLCARCHEKAIVESFVNKAAKDI